MTLKLEIEERDKCNKELIDLGTKTAESQQQCATQIAGFEDQIKVGTLDFQGRTQS